MSNERTFDFVAADGTRIAAFHWPAVGEVRGLLQISHGMGEHALRYLPRMSILRDAGFSIYAEDHRGHGKTASKDALGDFGPGGFSGIVDDMAALSRIAKRENPGKKLVLLGHSLGSFALQIYLLTHSALIDGAVLSGSAALDLMPPPDPDAGGLEAFNASFEPARTKFDWLSRDETEVDKYVGDPLCGFSASPNSMISIFAAAAPLFDSDALKRIRADLPIYLFAGDKDPLNGGLAFLAPLVDRYRAAGVRDVQSRFYPGGRHEMLNETNRAQVLADLKAWLDHVV
ncbi:MAG: alpha/beta hydrolase [Micropepsaceae bacterium]